MRLSVFLVPLALMAASCSNTGANTAAGGAAQSAVVGTPAPGSKFSRVRIGMTHNQVEDLIGKPTDEDTHMTGKAFIPFYFGGGTTAIEDHYKGEGVLAYESRNVGSTVYQLAGIRVNPAETGYVQP